MVIGGVSRNRGWSIAGYSVITVVLFLLILMGAVGCKKDKEGPDYSLEDELERLEAYRRVHYPQATSVGTAGFCMKTYSGGGSAIGENDWFEMDFIAFDLSGNLQSTSIRKAAQKYGHQGLRLHYVPHIVRLNQSSLSPELYQALRSATIGDTLVVGLPASSVKTLGIWRAADYTSSVITVVPRLLIEDTEKYERERIAEYLAAHPGFQPFGNIYRMVLEEGRGETIKDENTLWLQFAGYFLDGMLFDTNVLEEAQNHNFKLTSSHALQMKASGDKQMIDGFSGAFNGLKVGSRVRLLIPSDFAYGLKGNLGIRPLETLVFEVSIIRGE